MLHTPLMSGTNAIHGVVIVGAMLVARARAKGASLGRSGSSPSSSRPRTRRRVRRHRPDARDVQEARAEEVESGEERTNAHRISSISSTIVTSCSRWHYSRTLRTRVAGTSSARSGCSSRSSSLWIQDRAGTSGWALVLGMLPSAAVFGAVAARKSEDDGDAADGRAVQRHGRRRGGTRLNRGVPRLAPDAGATRRSTIGHDRGLGLIGAISSRERWWRSGSCRSLSADDRSRYPRPAGRERRCLPRAASCSVVAIMVGHRM